MSNRALIIISAAERDLGNQIALASFDPLGGAKTFTVPLYAASAVDDSSPVAYWCSAQFDDSHWPLIAAFEQQFTNPIVVQYDLSTQPGIPDQTLAANHLRRGLSKML